MHDIGTAIEYLHHMDIAHRDVKVMEVLHRAGEDRFLAKYIVLNIYLFSFFSF